MTNLSSLLDHVLFENNPVAQDLMPMLRDVEHLLPVEIRDEFLEHKEDIGYNLGIIATIFPSIKKEASNILNAFIRGVEEQIMESIVGEPIEVVQRARINVLKSFGNILNLIPKEPEYNAIRENVRIIRDYFNRVIGRTVLKSPGGERQVSIPMW